MDQSPDKKMGGQRRGMGGWRTMPGSRVRKEAQRPACLCVSWWLGCRHLEACKPCGLPAVGATTMCKEHYASAQNPPVVFYPTI